VDPPPPSPSRVCYFRYARFLAEGRATELYEAQMVAAALEAEKASALDDLERLKVSGCLVRAGLGWVSVGLTSGLMDWLNGRYNG